MKTSLAILAFFSLLFAGSALAQGRWDLVATFDAPFDFVVSGTTLPAGHYLVRTAGNGHTLMIQNADTRQSTMSINNNILLSPYRSHESTKVMFGLNSDGRQVLHQICITGDD